MSALQPARRPERIILEGPNVRLEPLEGRHALDLFRAAGPERYAYLPSDRPADEAGMASWAETAAQNPNRVYWAVTDRESGVCQGRQALMSIVPEHGTIEIGAVLWGDGLARTLGATEALFLHARYVFDELGYRRFEWKCNALNAASRGAALRFGFTFEGIFRQHQIVRGANRDTAWHSMLDCEWPERRTAFERWLHPDNFDADGRQRSKLRFEQRS